MIDLVAARLQIEQKEFTAAAYYEDGRIFALELQDPNEEYAVGSILAGAFIENAAGGGAILSVGKNKRVFVAKWHPELVRGGRAALQVVRPEEGQKKTEASQTVRLSGRLAVVTNESPALLVSHSIEAQEAARIKAELKGRVGLKYKTIVRTEAAEALAEEIAAEAAELSERMDELLLRCASARLGSIEEGYEPWETIADSIKIVPDRIFCGLPAAAKELSVRFPDAELHEESGSSLTVAQRFGLGQDVVRLSGRRVFIKGGGYLLIDEAAACTCIDINSGKMSASIPAKQLCHDANVIALKEAFRQIRLRNLGGIIVIDLLKAGLDEARPELLALAGELAADDPRQCEVTGISKAGLLEAVRQKKGRSVRALLRPDDCAPLA